MEERRYLQPYQRWAQQHGADFGVTLWASPRSQQRRFEVFWEMFDFAGAQVVDAGCSRGDFAAFLLQRKVSFQQYVGLDALPEALDFARGRKLARCRFEQADLLEQPHQLAAAAPDVVAISGTLNTMTDEQALAVLEAAWAATSDGLIFNFLSDRCSAEAPLQDDFARRLSTLGLLDWAFSHTWSVVLRQDYFPAGHDATICMRKA